MARTLPFTPKRAVSVNMFPHQRYCQTDDTDIAEDVRPKIWDGLPDKNQFNSQSKHHDKNCYQYRADMALTIPFNMRTVKPQCDICDL